MNWINNLKGGAGSGNFGHDGLVDVHGGSSTFESNKRDRVKRGVVTGKDGLAQTIKELQQGKTIVVEFTKPDGVKQEMRARINNGTLVGAIRNVDSKLPKRETNFINEERIEEFFSGMFSNKEFEGKLTIR